MPERPKPPEVWWDKGAFVRPILPEPERPPSRTPSGHVGIAIVSVGLVLLRLGLGLMGVTINLALGVFVMFVAFCLFAYAFWTWPLVVRWPAFVRLAIILIAAALYFGLVGAQAERQYKKQHPFRSTQIVNDKL